MNVQKSKIQIVLPNFILKWHFLKTFIISGIIFGIGIFSGFISPNLFESTLKNQINLTPNSERRESFVKVPFFMDFKIYLFNLTNPEEVTQGGKPEIQEVGPYFFEEWKEKFDLIDNDANDTLRYHFKNTYKFRPDLSGSGLTGNEIITMPHPLVATMLLMLNVDNKPMVPMAKTAIDKLFNSPTDIFWTGRVMDILFDGIPIDCSNKELFEVQVFCGAFENGGVEPVFPHNDTYFAFSLLQTENGTDLGEFTVLRGKKNSSDIGRIVAFNDDTKQDMWDEDECNQYVGTDSTIFAPYMNVNDGIWVWEYSICRPIFAQYEGDSNYMGVETAEFTVNFSSPENAKQCFCRDPDECPKKGTIDLFPCIGVPWIGSQPHFYGADPSLLDDFKAGIFPNKDKHAISTQFELTTGTPIKEARRLQLNLELVPIEDIPYMADLRQMYYPLFWVEEGFALNETFVNRIKRTVILPIKAQSCLKWAGLIIGSMGLVISSILFCLVIESKLNVSTPQSLQPKSEI